MGVWARDAEWEAAVRELRNALHGDAGAARSENPPRQLSDDGQEAAGWRNESGDAADGLLHSEPAAESEEPAESTGVPAFLRDGDHLEVRNGRLSPVEPLEDDR